MRGSWKLNKDCNILTSPASPDIAVCRSRSPGLLNRRPGGPLRWVLFSLPLLVSNSSALQLTQTSYVELYYCFTPTQSILTAGQAGIYHFRRLWTVMFDHHQAEITVMQFSFWLYCGILTLSHIISQARQRNLWSGSEVNIQHKISCVFHNYLWLTQYLLYVNFPIRSGTTNRKKV